MMKKGLLFAVSTILLLCSCERLFESRKERLDRWYNDIRAWRVERGAAPAPAETPVINAPKVEVPDFSKAANDPDDLPF